MLQSTDRSPAGSWLVSDDAAAVDQGPTPEIAVRFVDDDRPFISVLEVVVPGKWDVIADVYRTLYNLRAQVIHAVIRYVDDGAWLRYRLYVVEFDGAMLELRRHREIIDIVEARLRALAPEIVPVRAVGPEDDPARSGVRRAPLARTTPRAAGIERAGQVVESR